MFESFSNPEKWILFGIPLLFLWGSMIHFLYDFSGKKRIIGLFSPINESVWEHTKLGLVPITLWWGIYYIVNGSFYDINPSVWFTSCLISLITSIITMPTLFYFYTQSFACEALLVDIFIFFLSILFGQLLGLHFYQYGIGVPLPICIFLFCLIFFVYALFTFYPPRIPLFRDNTKGSYGILEKR